VTSIFDLFKIGIGPSSSHTVGPMRAAKAFADTLDLTRVRRLRIELYGSLGLTGRGHGTDRAVILGLLGEEPDKVDPAQIDALVGGVRQSKRIANIAFDESRDLLFRGDLVMPAHPNAMQFTAFNATGAVLSQEMYYSVGGGFIEGGTGLQPVQSQTAPIPHPFQSARQLPDQANAAQIAIWEVILQNEKATRTEAEIRDRIDRIWTVMQECTTRGLTTDGILPGGLNVRRRRPRSHGPNKRSGWRGARGCALLQALRVLGNGRRHLPLLPHRRRDRHSVQGERIHLRRGGWLPR
jgi:L-serine dehydratase